MANINIPGGQTNLRNSIVDLLATKDINMKKRRVINASDAKDDGDYVTLVQLKEVAKIAADNLTTAILGLVNALRQTGAVVHRLITSIISPEHDADGILITKEDGTTPVIFIDTDNAAMMVNGPVYSTNEHLTAVLPTIPFIAMQYVPSHTLNLSGDLVCYDPLASLYLPISIRCSDLTLGSAGGKIGFFTDDTTQSVAQQVLIPYTTNIVGTFTGISNAASGNVYATVADLNTLRLAYNNLRLMCDDLRTKLLTSTLVKQ